MLLKSLFGLVIVLCVNLQSQSLSFIDKEDEKCGPYDHTASQTLLKALGDHWGYSYENLLSDLEIWQLSPYVQVDSMGASVEGRTLWELTISGPDSNSMGKKRVVYIHARTHPNEIQGWWVTNELINILLSETKLGEKLRNSTIFHIVPMYNPDGVELEYARENAHGVDIESNWYASVIEPEVLALRSRFIELMNSEKPINLALNMHSSYRGKRFFVCHDSVGTSAKFLEDEKHFIDEVQAGFIEGIEPWNYLITWTSGTALKYPESWFWVNHQESVMALTYEDNNSDLASAFDTSASAISNGIFRYLNPTLTQLDSEQYFVPQTLSLQQNYPNPFNPATTIPYRLTTRADVNLTIYDVKGHVQVSHNFNSQQQGIHNFLWDGNTASGRSVDTGVYFCRLRAGNFSQTIKMVLIK